MKIKKNLLVAFCALGLCVSTTNAVALEPAPYCETTNDVPDVCEKIILQAI